MRRDLLHLIEQEHLFFHADSPVSKVISNLLNDIHSASVKLRTAKCQYSRRPVNSVHYAHVRTFACETCVYYGSHISARTRVTSARYVCVCLHACFAKCHAQHVEFSDFLGENKTSSIIF